jgi:hypothetical protein
VKLKGKPNWICCIRELQSKSRFVISVGLFFFFSRFFGLIFPPFFFKEEEFLIIESRKIEQNSKKLLRDREHVIKLMNTIDSAFSMKKFFPQKRAAMEAASKLAMKPPPPQVESLEPLRVCFLVRC